MYVDDLVTGAESDKQAYKLYMGAKRLLRSGAFNLRKFSTNSSCLQAKVDGEEASPTGDLAESTPTATSQATLGNSQGVHDGKQKVLCVNWSVSSDQFIFSFAELAKQAQGVEPTKRSITTHMFPLNSLRTFEQERSELFMDSWQVKLPNLALGA